MVPFTRRDRLSLALGLGLVFGVVPACSAQSGGRLPSAQGPGSAPGSSGNIVYRPIYRGLGALPPRKPFYPAGYAGATYPPVGQGPVLNPTGYWVRSRAARGGCTR